MPRDFSLQDVWAAPMAGSRHNGLPTGKLYRYGGKGFDQMDPTDPGHPDYIKPHLRKALAGPTTHGTETMRATGCTCGPCRPAQSTNDRARRTTRRTTDKGRKTAQAATR